MRHGIYHLGTNAWLAPGAAWTERAAEAVKVEPTDGARWIARHAPEPAHIVVAELPLAGESAA